MLILMYFIIGALALFIRSICYVLVRVFAHHEDIYELNNRLKDVNKNNKPIDIIIGFIIWPIRIIQSFKKDFFI